MAIFIIIGLICAIQIPVGIYNWLIAPNSNSIRIETNNINRK